MATGYQVEVDGLQKHGMEPIQPRNEDTGIELNYMYGGMEPKDGVTGMGPRDECMVTDSPLHIASDNSNIK